MHPVRKLTAIVIQLAVIATFTFNTASARSNGGRDLIKPEELKEWLSFISSDDFEGRDTFSEGLGMTAMYLASQLKSWGVKPGGPNGSYFQRVPVLSVKADNRSTVTVEVGGESRTFKHSEGATFSANVGAKRTFTGDQIEFAGYGLHAPPTHDDFAKKNVRGKMVVYLGGLGGPKGLDPSNRRLVLNRARTITDQLGATAAIGPDIVFTPVRRGNSESQTERPDFITAERIDREIPPIVAAKDELLEFLFSQSEVKYADLKIKADQGEPLPSFTLKNVRITFNIDADNRVIRTQYTRNVIGIVEGSDAQLKGTYVAFGAHYDHVGYSEGEITETPQGPRMKTPRGRIGQGAGADRIWNGADDDGSGTIAILAIAKAFARGKRPRRSLIFVWHTGEEKGLWGSRHFADNPTVPIESIVAQVNMDMVGRNFKGEEQFANHIFIVGADRISTELHNITIDANQSLAKPIDLDFAMNDPGDPEQIYYRSDHYSYAARGIPVVFFFSGIHPDYHGNTDHVDKINFDKMTRVSQMAYEIGERVANMTRPPARDNRGPRAGKGSSGKLSL